MLFTGPDGPGKDLEWIIVRPGGLTVGSCNVLHWFSPPAVAIADNGCCLVFVTRMTGGTSRR